MQNPAIVGANPALLEDVSAQLQLHELGTIDDAPATLSFDRENDTHRGPDRFAQCRA